MKGWSLKGKGVEILKAPINRSNFNYLSLIKSPRSNYEVRIVVIIITTQNMFRMILQITANRDEISAKYVNIRRYISFFGKTIYNYYDY